MVIANTCDSAVSAVHGAGGELDDAAGRLRAHTFHVFCDRPAAAGASALQQRRDTRAVRAYIICQGW